MRLMSFSRFVLSGCALAALLAGCGGSQLPIGAPGASSSMVRPPTEYTSLYSFQGKPDGETPEARVIPFDNVLYGTTSAGGTKCARFGCGTVFKITYDGRETVLHRFQGVPDGAQPLAELVASGQELYGTTNNGGVLCTSHKRSLAGCGTVFAIGTSGTERVLHSFTGVPDGAYAQGPLTMVSGRFYGTTINGGRTCAEDTDGCGTVYSIDSSGKERVLYRFAGKPDGATPNGNLVFLGGTLYGTTLQGGAYGEGTVFAVTSSGSERVVYSSKGPPDMRSPSGLVVLNGVLYGSSGGGRRLEGAVYAVTTGGNERVLHSFYAFANGDNPFGRLIAVNGLLFGTTSYGGRGSEAGLVYAMSTAGKLRVLYRFKGEPDGIEPYAGVIDAKGMLYGTAASGGSGCHYQSCQDGYGTVFRLSP